MLTVGRLRAADGDVRIRELRASDLGLYLALRGDADTMRDLGGPQPPDRIAASHAREVADVEAGRAWIAVAEVRTDDGWLSGGYVSLVRHAEPGQQLSELGWMVLPAHRRRGVAGTAVRLLLGLPGAAQQWGPVEAYPSSSNVASNRLCAAMGFDDLGEIDLDFAGQRFRCTRWRLEPPYGRSVTA